MNLLSVNLKGFARLRYAMLAMGMLFGTATASEAAPAPPHLTANTTNTYGIGNVATVVNSSVTLTAHSSVVFTAGKVSIGNGFDASDELVYTQVHGISGNYDSNTGVLYLTGNGTAAEYQDAFRSVKFRNTDASITATTSRTINFSIGAALYNEHNGHYYELLEDSDNYPSWTSAKNIAAGRTYYGLQGYLVTVTSAEENNFLAQKINSDTWIGASDSHTEGVWRWVTGPEGLEDGGLGRQFSEQFLTGGVGGCSANQAPGINGHYANWAPGEPNDCDGYEDVAHFIGGTSEWNDYPDYDYMVSYYLVEYGGMPGDPVIQVADTMMLTVTGMGVNSAPVITGSISLPAANEDVAATTSRTVADILNGYVSDADGDAVGMAIYGTTGNGQWQRSTDNATWYGVDYNSPGAAPLSAGNMSLLGPNVYVRFVPDANWNGNAALFFVPWDQTHGTSLGFEAITGNGGTHAYGQPAIVYQNIDAVNDAPEVIMPNTAGVLNFGGGSEYVDLPDLNISGPNFTVEAWVYIDNVNKNWARVIDLGNGSANNNIIFGFEGGSGRLFAEVYNGSSSLKVSAPSVFPANQWIHVAAVWSGTTATIYQNGVAVASGAQLSIANVTRVNNYLGKSNWADEYLDGKMTDIRMWSTARSQSEIAGNMTTQWQGNEPGLLLYYKASEVGSSYLAEYGTSNKWGTMVGTNWLTVQAPVASVSTPKNTARTISGIQLSDLDAASYDVTVTFSVANGTLSTTAPGVVTGNGTATLSVTNNLTALNAAFNAGSLLTYTPTTNFTGTDELTVNLNDAGAYGSGGALTDEKSIIINVIPSQNTAPVMGNQTFSVNENSTNGTVVGTIAATDADGNPLTFSLVSQTLAGAYAVAANGQITVADASLLDYETVTSSTISVQVSDGSATATATITININDVNEAPAISAQAFPIDENSANGTVVGSVTATDVDGDALIFSIASQSVAGAFAIDSNGQITVADASMLDFEANPTITLTVEVTDGDFTQSATITINVGNINEAPVMADATIATDEDTDLYLAAALQAGGQPIFTDVDGDDVQVIKFTALPTNGTLMIFNAPAYVGQQFSIWDFQGAYYVPAANYNGTDTFGIIGSDGQLWAAAPASITINVNAVNDAPILEDVVMTTNEDQSATFVDFVSPTTYTDIESNPLAGVKIVQLPSHGTLTLFGDAINAGDVVPAHEVEQIIYTPNADFNGADSFTFNATDGTDFAAADATAHITVVPVNDGPTDLAATTTAVDENSAVGTVVTSFTATDIDAGDSHYYQLVSGAGDQGNIYFNMVNNQLEVANNINYEATTQLSIRVQTIDQSGELFEKAILLDVNDQNDAPTQLTLSNNVIDEQQPMGTFVGIVATADEDAGDSHTLALVSGAGDADNASFDIVNNVLVTNAVLDYNTQQQYFIRVRSTDAQGASIEETFVINLNDINQAPTAIAISNATIAENNLIGALVGFFNTTDPDANDTHTYTLVSGAGDDDNASFSISGNDLNAAEVFDFETKTSYTVRVRATDAAGAYAEEVFTISILDAVDAPMGITMTATSIDENDVVGTLVGTFATIDPDQTGGHTYGLVAGAGSIDNGAFYIAGNALYSSMSFNYEAKSSYSIRVRSVDNANGYTEEVFTITINDLNDTPTDVTVTIIGVDENSSIGTTAGFLGAIDEDVLDTHTFTLAPGYGSADNGKFSILANKLQVNANLNYEAQSSFAVRLRATDNTGAFTEKYITIVINDVNETPSSIALSASTIAENEPAGAVIGTFTTADEDNADSHAYSLVAGAGDADNAAFYISGNMLVANASFNFEAQSSFSIRVASTDMGGLSHEEVFTISIINQIDAPMVAALTKVIFKNTPQTFSKRDFIQAFSQEEGRALTQIRVASLPTHGDLLFMNTPVVVGQTFLVAELNSLSYSPMLGYVGGDDFTFTAYDGVSYSADANYHLDVIQFRQIGGVGSTLDVTSLSSLNPVGNTNREGELTTVEEMPMEIAAFGNYPNPFQEATNITFELPASMKVTLEVYDMLGRKVDTLVDGEELAGKQTIVFNGNEAGQYICRLVATGANGEVIIKNINLMQVK